MTEKEIIKQIKNDINVGEFYGITEDSIKGLLDLYNKEKEKNRKIKESLTFRVGKSIKIYRRTRPFRRRAII